ncbi:MAG: hypothetical protein JWL76_1628 [Thermoleophilia bacterium]|nr:hypothetical protein [Thermoleophilia bacterium]
MSYPHENESQSRPRADQPRSGFAGPSLNLPRFQFAPSSTLARPAADPSSAPTAPAAHEPAPAWLQPNAARPPAPAPRHHAPQQYTQMQHAPAPAPTWQTAPNSLPTPMPQPHMPQHHMPQHHAPQHQLAYATAPAPAPMPVATAPAPTARRAPAPTPVMQNSTTRATVSWDRVAPPAERTLLQKITPVHMGVLMVMVMIMMVVSSGPGAMSAKPSQLSALASGGGVAGDVPMPVRAGSTAVSAVTAPAKGRAVAPAAKGRAAAPRVRSGARMIVVGSARLRANVRSGGIPSPAASANLAVAGGGRVSAADTGSVQMGGIPSPAASEQLGPQKLPFRPTDGVTLPRMSGERDGYAVDRHYGNATLPMEEPAAPAMTPGAAAERAEAQVRVNNLTGGSTPQPVNGGLVVQY